MDRSSKRRIINLHVIIGILALFTRRSKSQTLHLFLSELSAGTVEQGHDAVYQCELFNDGGPAHYGGFRWVDVSVFPSVDIFTDGATYPKYNNFEVSETGGTYPKSTMTITNTQIEDEGRYKCLSGSLETDAKELKVEVQSTRSLTVGSATADDTDVYIAMCRATGGRPQETLTLMLGGDPAPCDGLQEYTLQADLGFSSKEIVCTFPATIENYGETLKCVISGHDISALNGEITEDLEMHNPPCNGIVTVTFESLDPNLRITCDIDAANQSFPAIRHYFIYANDILKHKSSTGGNSVNLTESEYDPSTEFECVVGNYLGNTTSGKKTYGPQKTTEKMTTSHPTTEYEEETTSEPTSTPCPCSLSGLSSGAFAGIAILAILLVASIIINIVQFTLLRRRTKPEFDGSKMNEKRDEVNTPKEVNDNVAYEMIQSGDRAYTTLQLDSSHSFIIARENVTFFTILGSIGRGDFGEVWKGDLRSNQHHLDVAIRQIPDRVIKSLQVLESIKALYKLSDQPNIVKCLGYCKDQGSILYEFISGGTLLTHLQTSGVQSRPTYSNLKPNGVRTDEGTLLNLAWQVAKGMQFLASKKIIHGALCAHNVLLEERMQCKISDYGLSSSLFGDVAKPTRWSSPETMATNDQTTEGDIWSFGIVLWEIVTLGARPYPKMTFTTVQTEVAKGYQMQRPRHCAQEVYAIMSTCWKKDPTSRTNFDRILEDLTRILEKTHSYLSLNDLDERVYASTLDL